MARKRMATSALRPKTLHQIYKRGRAIIVAKELSGKFGRIISTKDFSKYNNTEAIAEELKKYGFVYNKNENLYLKI